MEVTKEDLLDYGFLQRQCTTFIEAAFDGAPDAQKEDVRRIFMAGALVFYGVMTNYPESMSDDEMMKVMMLFNSEFEAVQQAAHKRALDA